MSGKGRGRLSLGMLQHYGQHRLLKNASSLFGATAVTSLLGFVFWAVAARLASPTQVGVASSAIAAMQLAATLGTLGLGTLLLGEIPRVGHTPLRLIGRALQLCAVAGLCSGVIGAVTLAATSPASLPREGWGHAVLFVLGTALTTLTIVVDQALIGLDKSRPQFSRNVVFSSAKLALLPVIATLADLTASAIYGAWIAGHLLSLLILARRLQRGTWRSLLWPKYSMRGLGRSAVAHHVTNTASYAPVLVLPVVVAAVLGSEDNAAFYAASLLATSVWVVATHLSTALFASAGVDHAAFVHGLRLSLRVSGLVSLLAIVIGVPLSSFALSLFGAHYELASTGLRVLLCATPFFAIKSLTIAVYRARDQFGYGAAFTLAGSLAEIVAGSVGSQWSVTAVCIGWGSAAAVEAAVFWPRLARQAGLGLRRRS